MFKADFFISNRQKLYEKLPSNSIVVLTAHGTLQRSEDQAYEFEQESNFWYLTGVNAADWLFIADVHTGQEWLVAPTIGKSQEIFDGSLAPEKAIQCSGVKEVLHKKAGYAQLKKILAAKPQVHTLLPYPRKIFGFYSNPAQRDLLGQLKAYKPHDLRLLLAKQRAVKQPEEIKAIQQAIDVTAAGLAVAMQAAKQFAYEYEAEAALSFEFRRRGLQHAFRPIIASGKNACTLHYDAADSKIESQSLLLFDVGARAHHYAADIARTISLRRATPRQQAVFEAVARAQKDIIALVKPGVVVKDYLRQVQTIMQGELVGLGLMKATDKPEGIYHWMPHAIGHGLGLDVHDSLGRPEVFEESMVLTVEPGIYISDEAIGVRIEDNILITKNGPEVMSKHIPISL